MCAIRIGTGAGYAGDRIDSAKELVEKSSLDYLVLEGLAERTTAIAQIEKSEDSTKGYGAFLEERMEELLPVCHQNGTTLITNLGAANPSAALECVKTIKEKLNLDTLKAVAVSGSDVLSKMQRSSNRIWETEEMLADTQLDIVSADAYLGVEQILPALEAEADVIITGRVADPSLFLAPMVYEFDWSLDDWHKLGAGTVFAHLLECGAQVTGGYFADGAYKQVPDLAAVGMPYAEVDSEAQGYISKAPGSGGKVTISTCTEQLLYEVMDPAAYITPDVVADFSGVRFEQADSDKVTVEGGTGRRRTDTLKVTLGVNRGYLGEGMIGYAGHHALERARMAKEIIKYRLDKRQLEYVDIKYEMIGLNALHGQESDRESHTPYEVMLRVAGLASDKYTAEQIGNEIEALWLNGPGGPGGVRKNSKKVIAAYSSLIGREETNSALIGEGD